MRRTMSLVLLAGIAPCLAQPIEWNNAGGGNWNEPGNWNPMNVPNIAAETAHISLAGAYTVTLNTSPTIGGLFINNAAATLAFPTGAVLFINGPTSTNNGLIVINTTMGGSATRIRFDQDCVLTGTGRITLNASTNRDTAYLETFPPAVLTHGMMHTIEGTGRIFAPMINDGLVTANVSGRILELLSNGKTNNGIMRAQSDSTLQVSGINVMQGASGRFEAITNGEILLAGATTNGVIDSAGGRTTIAGTVTLRDAAHAGPLNMPTGTVVFVRGAGLTQSGLTTVNTTQGGSATLIRFDDSGVLGGTGTTRLNAGANLDTAYIETNTGIQATLAASHTIAGTGRIFALLVNNGLISADVNDRTLELLSRAKTNNAVIEARGGATVLVNGITVTQGAGARFVADGGALIFRSATTNGRVNASNGAVDLQGSNTWTNVDVSGPVRMPTGSVLLVRGTGLVNDDEILVNTTQGGSATLIRFDETGAFLGDGIVILNAGINLDTSYIETNAGVVCTNSAQHTIRGTGRIPALLVNEGAMLVDVPGRSLELVSRAKTNRGLIEVKNGATLLITGITVTQEGAGRVDVVDGLMRLSSSTINGRVNASGGKVDIAGSVTLRDVDLSGPLHMPTGTSVLVRGGGLTHDDTIRVNMTQGASATFIRFDENGSFMGSGKVVLNASANRDTAFIETNVGISAVNTSDHTIRGTGRIPALLDNQGDILADVDGRALELQSRAKTNSGLMAAVNNSTLIINGITVAQQPGGIIKADNGHVTMSNAVVNGELDFGLGSANVTGTTTFGDVHLQGPVGVDNGSVLRIVSSLNNDGAITVNPQAGAAATHMMFMQSTTVQGSGSVTLNASGNLDTAYLEGAAGTTIAFGSQQTLKGRGRIYKPLIMGGTISPGMSAGLIEPRAGYTQTGTGVYACDVGGPSPGQFDQIAVAGQAVLAGELRITRIGGFEPAACTSVPILTATGGVVGAFETVTGMTPGTNKIWRVFYGANSVTLRSACYADFNGDCVFDIFDFLEWQNAFVAQNPEACNCDVTTGQNVCDIFDFLCFANRFALGGC